MKAKDASILEFPVPTSADLEGTILAELISDSASINDARKIVKAEFFSTPEREKCFRAICLMDEKRNTVDLVTVNAVMGMEFMNENIIPHIGSCGSGSAITAHCKALAEAYIRRRGYQMALRILQKSCAVGNSVQDDIIDATHAFEEELTAATKSNATVSISQALGSLADSLQQEDKHVTTGIEPLDELTYGGFEGGDLEIIAARPSVGKTAVALHMAHMAARAGKKVAIISLEMSKEQLAKRYLFATEQVNPYEVSRRNVDWGKFENVVSYYENLNIYINDRIRSIEEIVAEITGMVREGKLDVVFIDYLGIIREVASEGDGNKKANLIGMVTSRLKELARELRIPIVLLAQLNRNSVLNGTNRPPQLSDLRDSGSIEQDADMVLMLEPKSILATRTDADGKVYDMVVEMLNMWVRKNRNGKRDVAIELETNKTHTNYTPVGVIEG